MRTCTYLSLLLIGALGLPGLVTQQLNVGWLGVAVGFAAGGILVVAVFLTLRQTPQDLAPLGLRKQAGK